VVIAEQAAEKRVLLKGTGLPVPQPFLCNAASAAGVRFFATVRLFSTLS